jgi:RHS repeat-associated protein
VGNFTTLQRYGSTGSIQDNLTYTYTQGTNKVSSINSSLAVYNYDSNGNVKYDSHRGIGFMIYDPDNLPVTAYLTNGEQLIYENDVNGNRVRNTISGSSDNYYFNGADGKTEAVALLPLSNVTYNILGAGGDNIGQLRVINSNPARYYYLKDHLGSIKMTVDATGTVQGYDDYYPYGMQMTGRSMTSSEDGRYKFTGKERDASEGLDYFGKRYYDSWKGSWDQVEPALDKWNFEIIMQHDLYSLSPYHYAKNNPMLNVDLDGLSSLTFDKTTHTLTLYSKDGKILGKWDAYNNVDHRAKGDLPKNGVGVGVYNFVDTDIKAPHKHGDAVDKNGIPVDSKNGEYGENGIFRIEEFTDPEGDTHTDIGVHAGREDKGGPMHPTMGCIRTTGDAMDEIVETAKDDPLTTLTVQKSDNKKQTKQNQKDQQK